MNAAPVARGDYVLYWMIAARRTAHSFALDHAIARAVELGVPLLVFEPLRIGYQYASDRMHAFVLQGMADQRKAFEAAGITYLPYVEPTAGAARGLLAALAARASVVVTDEQPGFFLPRMVAAAGAALPVRVEQVDGNGMLPLRAAERAYPSAVTFRRHLQKTLPPHLLVLPSATPLARLPATVKNAKPPGPVLRKWPMATQAYLESEDLSALPIDHAIAPVPYRGGSRAGAAVLRDFIGTKLARYSERSHPDADVASGLSPYLHFGHVGAHAVYAAVMADAKWDPSRLAPKATGSRNGWWGLPADHEAFIDEIVTWRELGYGFCHHVADYSSYESLPEWARKTMDAHASDPRPERYTREQLETGTTGDPLWNAAQRQLLVEGRIQNYMRMLWGKKILEWTASPQDALATLVELNNKYAVDGRNPNSWSGITWTLGRFDRPWGPVRPIFGTIRYMSSASTRRKLDLSTWLARWS